MHPTLVHLGPIALPVQGFLIALGLLAGTQISCSLAARVGLVADRIWTLCVVTFLTLFLGERLLVVSVNLGDFLRHPFWMLGLTQVRDERYFYGASILALCAGYGYIWAWRLPLLRVADVLAPGAGLLSACISLSSLAAGKPPNSPTAALGTRAGQTFNVPVPAALCIAALHLTFAAIAFWLALRAARVGGAASFWLFAAGCTTILLAQLRSPSPGDWLLFNAFTPAEVFSIAGLTVALWLWWHPARRSRTSPVLPEAPGPDL